MMIRFFLLLLKIKFNKKKMGIRAGNLEMLKKNKKIKLKIKKKRKPFAAVPGQSRVFLRAVDGPRRSFFFFFNA